MDKKTLTFLAVMVALIMALVLVVGAMGGGLSKAVKQQYMIEKQRLENIEKGFDTTKKTFTKFKNDYPDYFTRVDEQEDLAGMLASSEQKFKEAETQFKSSAQPLYEKDNKNDDIKLSAEIKAINLKTSDAAATLEKISKRIERLKSYRTDWKELAKTAQEEYGHIANRTFLSLEEKIQQAQQDWPDKKSDLETRFSNFSLLADNAEKAYAAVQSEIDKSENQIDYLLIGNNADLISRTRSEMQSSADELSKLVDQLYYSYDKKLADMEIREGEEVEFYHYYQVMKVDQNDDVSEDSEWKKVTEAEYKKMEKNLGMVVESKPKGKYDFEATKSVIPPGYNYVGNSHYGHWQTDRYGHRYWSYYPRYYHYPYFFYGSGYRSHYIYYDDWYTYRSYRSYGRPYYGTSRYGTSLYGSNGSYTKKSYSSSKYMKSSGYSNSQYKKSGGTYKGSKYASSSKSGYSSSKYKSSSSSSSRGWSSSRSRSSGGK